MKKICWKEIRNEGYFQEDWRTSRGQAGTGGRGGWKQAHKAHPHAHAGITWPEAASGDKEVIPLCPSVCEAWDARPGLSAPRGRKERSVPLEFSSVITGSESASGCGQPQDVGRSQSSTRKVHGTSESFGIIALTFLVGTIGLSSH